MLLFFTFLEFPFAPSIFYLPVDKKPYTPLFFLCQEKNYFEKKLFCEKNHTPISVPITIRGNLHKGGHQGNKDKCSALPRLLDG
jgi:hypothetical protein